MYNKCYKEQIINKEVRFNFFMSGTRFAPHQVFQQILGGFESKPCADMTFIEMMEDYLINNIIKNSVIEEDKKFLTGIIFFYDYNLNPVGQINLKESSIVGI